jgi:hypothetical protein
MAVIGGKNGKHKLVMGVSIYLGRYDRAQMGMHHWMGEKVVHDYRLSKNALIALQEILEEEWVEARFDAVSRLEVAQLVCFLFLGYARALRGEAITKI